MNKIAMTFLGSALGGAGFLASYHALQGCAASPTVANDPHPSIASAITTTGDVAGDVGDRADRIDTHTNNIGKHITPAQVPVFGPFLDGIHDETAGLRVDKGKLEQTQTQLQQADRDSTVLKTQNEKLTKDVQELTDEKNNGLRHLTYILITLSVLGIGTSVALLYLGNSAISIPLAVGCAGTLVLSLILNQFAIWLAIGGGVVLAGGIGYLIYRLVIQQRATVQIAQTAETAKQLMPPVARAMAFGSGSAPGYADTYQTPTTRKLVQKVRSLPLFKQAPPHDLVAQAQAAGVEAAQKVVAQASAK